MKGFIGEFDVEGSSLVKLVIKPFVVGVGAGGAVFSLLLLVGVAGSIRVSFSVFGLLFAAAIVGWSVAVTSTRSILTYAAVTDSDLDWVEMDVRRSMTALCFFGIGGMVGVWIVTRALAVV